METSPFHLRGGYMLCIPEGSNPAVGLGLARFPPQRRSSVVAAAAAARAGVTVPAARHSRHIAVSLPVLGQGACAILDRSAESFCV